MRSSTRTLVLDAVGTVIYPEPSVTAAYTEIGSRFGSKLTRSEVSARFAAVFGEIEGRDAVGDLRTSESRELDRWQEIVARVLDDVADRAGCFAALFDHFADPRSWRVFSDVPRLFAACARSGARLVLASNFDRRLIRIARELEPLRQCAAIVVSSEVGYRKPHSEFFGAVRAAIVDGADTVYVGDDLKNDWEGARAAGFSALLLDRAGRSVNGAIRSLDELLPFTES